jgi:hypothetical protein
MEKLENDIMSALTKLSERLDSQEYTISAYIKHQRDGPGIKLAKWLIGLLIKGLFGYAMTIWIPRILGWR